MNMLQLLVLVTSVLFGGTAVETLWAVQAGTVGRKQKTPSATVRIFSGPQVGEPLAGFRFRRVQADGSQKPFDPVTVASGKPLLLVFVHKRTRPGIATVRLLTKYTVERRRTGITAAVVFLSDDPPETAAWIKRARRALPTGAPLGISSDGIEGPGALGLNRKVTLTVLLAAKGKVVANFALVQPSVQVDVPRILDAIVKVIGGKAPTLAQLGVKTRKKQKSRGGPPPEIAALLRQMIQKTATAEQVRQAAVKLEKAFSADRRVAVQVGRIGRRIITAGRLKMYGTPAAQRNLVRWAKKYAPLPSPKRKAGKTKRNPGQRTNEGARTTRRPSGT